ncbi:LolA family protein [Spirochaeta cellobiosiphila]|uniref:LolA family protein n=1 Tax=Spirochaeta cellobiosiphila TaxID=504483 RepID=UPI00042147F9|nr:outer-membrane lipoprotein carrier protein LolA [Spirochaeta cellobiosiphila]
MLKRIILLILMIQSYFVFGQDIVTASDFFKKISERYGTVQDYQAQLNIVRNGVKMSGTVSYKTPDKLRIDFTEPRNQVLVSTGENLIIYIPKYSVIMRQALRKKSSAEIASLASKQGLDLLRRAYSVAYLRGPSPVALDDKNPEKVVWLKMTWRTADETFRELKIAVGQNNLIRRIEGTTVGYENLVFDFKDIKTNQGIPNSKFEYDSDGTANEINNFLFSPEE